LRAGAAALSLLAVPLNVRVLRGLADGPRQPVELRCELGSPPQTTLRTHLRRLEGLGILAEAKPKLGSGTADLELGSAGRRLLAVSGVLEGWLAAAPDGEIALGGSAAKSAINALVQGWSTNMVRALAAQPMSLTELSGVISAVSYPSLERRLAAMRKVGLLERRSGRGGAAPHHPTAWLRHAIAPLAAAARWELAHPLPDSSPVAPRDVEAAFLLTLPQLRLSPSRAGACRMVVELGDGRERRLVGALVGIHQGRIAFCTTKLEGEPSAAVAGTAPAWLDALIDAGADRLHFSGEAASARELFDAFRAYLFAPATYTLDRSFQR
jgi:DNA-binding HxlR family transcriptional regulator